MSFTLSNSRGKGIAVSLVVLAVTVGVGSWWWIACSRSDNTSSVPERICKQRVSGEKAAPLLPAKGSKFQEDTIQFSTPQSSGSCRFERGGEEVYLVYFAGPGNYPRERIQRKGTPASLGDAYGYLSDKGEISLYVSCTSPSKGDKDRLVVGTSASIVRDNVTSGAELNKSTKGLRALSEFTAQAAHDLAEDWFKCPGADRLPNGPVTIHWDR